MAKKIPDAVRQYMAKIGAKGAKAGAQNRTAEERAEKARAAALARWKKKPRSKDGPPAPR